MDFAEARLPAAVAIAERVSLPLEARLVRVGVVEFRPVKELCAP